MNNYLHSLPFHKDAKNLSSCDCLKQGFDPPAFKLYSEADRLPTFVLRLPPLGETPDLTYANECVSVLSCAGVLAATITMSEAGLNIFKDGNSYYVVYDGSPISGLKLNCGECYRLKISNNYSEVFWITATPNEKIRLEFGNNAQLGDVPYQNPVNHVQVLLLDGEICSLDGALFKEEKSQSNGKVAVTYQRLTLRKGLSIFSAPDFVSQLISAAEMHESFSVFYRNEEFKPLKKRVTVEVSQNNCCDYDIEVTLPLREIEIKGGVCQTDVEGELTVVQIPDGLPDSCEVEDDWEPTDTVLCLKFGEVPPRIDPPIAPVGTPPVGGGIPPEGKVLSQNTQYLDCSVAWVHNGIKYKKKITKVVADGLGGSNTVETFIEPCEIVIVSHSISNLSCSNITPPVGTPPVGTPPVGSPPSGLLKIPVIGTYEADAGGRHFTYQKSPTFTISFNPDGSITDTTPGTVHGTNGNPSTCNGKNVFYLIDYSHLVDNGDGDNIYRALKNLYFEDKIHTISRYDCNPAKIPNLATFKANLHGYGDNGVNTINATLSQITVSIRTGLNPKMPVWLNVSRKLNFYEFAPDRPMSKWVFATTVINRDRAPEDYIKKGIHVALDGSKHPYPYGWFTYKKPELQPGQKYEEPELYSSYRNLITEFSFTPLSVLTDEWPENAQNNDPGIYDRMYHAWKGAIDKFRETNPTLNKRNTGLWGSYGVDRYTGYISKYPLYGPKAGLVDFLTDGLYNIFGTNTVASYLSSNQIDVRNVNVDYYMYNEIFHTTSELLLHNERIKLSTKQYQGQDRESDWILYTTTLSQTLVPNGVEFSRTGDEIPYANGTVTSLFNTPMAAVAGEYEKLFFIATLINRRGGIIWGGLPVGLDTTKLNSYLEGNQPIFWTPTGGTKETYVPGQNGAPLNDPNGMVDTLSTTVVDASKSGYDKARELEDYSHTIYFASYVSSRKSFTPVPGSAGLHLNGFGPLNHGLYCFKDAFDQKCGNALVGVGEDTQKKVGVYCNDHLSAHEYEDNVVITHQGESATIPRAFGRQFYTVIFGQTTPPVGTPPVGSPPVGTPPVGTPPVGTIPNTLTVMGRYNTRGFQVLLNETAPYYINCFNDAGANIYSTTSNNDEIEIPNTVISALGQSGIKIQATDASGKAGQLHYCGVSFRHIQSRHCFRSVANGSVSDHIEAINLGQSIGLNMTSVVTDSDEIKTDADLIEYGSYVLPLNAAYNANAKYPFDNTLIIARSKGQQVKVVEDLCLNANYLNNGTTRTLFYGEEDLQKHFDQSNMIGIQIGGISTAVPSPASDNFIAYVKRIKSARLNRYAEFFHEGTFVLDGEKLTLQGEDEYEYAYRPNGDESVTSDSKGDFHPKQLTAFAASFPEFASKTVNEIQAADRNNSALGRAWSWSLENVYHKFRNGWTDYVIANCEVFNRPGARKKWRVDDAGSYSDQLSPRRRVLNQMNKLHPSVLMIKSNDGTDNIGTGRRRFAINHGYSLALKAGGVFASEPSPPGGNNGFNGIGEETEWMSVMTEVGADVSFVYKDQLPALLSASNTVPGGARNYVELTTPTKKLRVLKLYLSDLYNNGIWSFGQTAYESYKAQNGLSASSYVHIEVIDNVNPSIPQPGI